MLPIQIAQNQFPYLLHLRASLQRKFNLLPHVLGNLDAIDSLTLHDIQKIFLIQCLNYLLSSDIELLLLIKEIFIQVLLNFFLFFIEVLLLKLNLYLMLLERGNVLHSGRRMVVDDDSVDVILQDLPCRLGLVWEAAASVVSLQFCVFGEDGLSVIRFILFPEEGVLLLHFLLADPEGDEFGRLFVLDDVVDGVKTVKYHFRLAF